MKYKGCNTWSLIILLIIHEVYRLLCMKYIIYINYMSYNLIITHKVPTLYYMKYIGYNT